MSLPIWFGNSLLRWALAAGLTAGVFYGLLFLRRTAVDHLRRSAERARSRLDDLLVDLTRRTGRLFFLVGAIVAGTQVLELPERAQAVLGHVVWLAIFFQVGLWADHVCAFVLRQELARRAEGQSGHRAALGLMGFFGRVAIWSVVALLALDNLGADVTAVVAGLAVGGIIAGLALQNVLKDTFASLAVVLDRPFEIGETIKVGNFVGKVRRIGIKTTRLRSVDGEELIFGNDDLLSGRIQNFGRLHERRATLRFAVSYDTPPDQLERVPILLREIVEAQRGPRFERAHFKEFGVKGLEFECVYWVLDPADATFMDVQQRIQLDLCRRLADAGIELAGAAASVAFEVAPPIRRSPEPVRAARDRH